VKDDHGALVGGQEEKEEEGALVPVPVRTAGASRALARRAARER